MEENPDSPQRKVMFMKIINEPSALIKMQARNETELDTEAKLHILETLFESKPAIFLEKYSRFLTASDADLFHKTPKDDYVCNFYLTKLAQPDSQKRAIIKNRRYEALQRLIKRDEYFSDEACKTRDPLLYEQMIERFKAHSKRTPHPETTNSTGGPLTHFFVQHLENLSHSQRVTEQQRAENTLQNSHDDTTSSSKSGEEEKDSESEEEEEEGNDDEDTPTAFAEIENSRQEFMSIMHRKFLNGEDENFDYSSVDNNDDYDNVDIEDQDVFEDYFDESDSDSEDPLPTNYGFTSQREKRNNKLRSRSMSLHYGPNSTLRQAQQNFIPNENNADVYKF